MHRNLGLHNKGSGDEADAAGGADVFEGASGFDDDKIRAAYDAAMNAGAYDAVEVHGPQGEGEDGQESEQKGTKMQQLQSKRGRKRKLAKAYACTNHMEYFAEISTAFFGGSAGTPTEEYNKWYPFNVQQLKQHDPVGYDAVLEAWRGGGSGSADCSTGGG